MVTKARKRDSVSERDGANAIVIVHGGIDTIQYLGLKLRKDQASLPKVVERGLPVQSADKLAGYMKMPTNIFVTEYIDIPRQTFHAESNLEKFTVSESDRIVRYAQLLKYATDMMDGDEEAALRWLNSPRPVLENRTPLEYARTEAGAEEVRHLIGRIEEGVWS